MNKLPKVIEDLIYNYKDQLEYSERLDKCLNELIPRMKRRKNMLIYEDINTVINEVEYKGLYVKTIFLNDNNEFIHEIGNFYTMKGNLLRII